ncbi:unnamed protein product [Fraxinus pennsylvanica]|uniref:Pentatricopeptide repeat-containing protein n=1 Tax=Fraxinus pennsylvanica TaxID=56036 RepID=A0AAD2E5V3_9LAMI|nr:unnamed protein product [Fraxinus pennsylvanica]
MAAKYWKNMKDAFLESDAMSYRTLLYDFSIRHMVGERGHILETGKVFSSCLDVNRMSVLGFNVMIKACGISKRFSQACCVFDSMEKHSIIPDKYSYNSLMQMLASAELPEKAKFYVKIL